MSEDEQKQILSAWLQKYRGLILKIVRAYALSNMDREDLFQEISIQVWRSIPNFRRESAVSTWIYRISLNVALTWVRGEKKHRSAEDLREPLLIETDDNADQRIEWLYQQLAGLDKIDRSLAIMLLDGLSYNEMSEILGITPSNVGVKIHRIKKELASRAKQYNFYGV